MNYYFTGKPLMNKANEIRMADDVLEEGDVVLLYFSASWCEASVELNKKLVAVYQECVTHNKNLTVINVPSEESEQDTLNFFKTQGDWYSVLYGDVLIEELHWAYDVRFVPRIIVLTKGGKIITKDGCGEIMSYGKNVLVKWF